MLRQKLQLFIYSLLLSTNVFAVCGDADQSYFVDILDAYKVAHYSSGLAFLGGFPKPNTIETAIQACRDADVNADFNVSMTDALIMARYVIGLTSLQCVDESQLCTDSLAGGPTAWQRQSFFSCLNQFSHELTGVPLGEWSFNQVRCPATCPHVNKKQFSPCEPLPFWPTPIPPNLGSSNGCMALSTPPDFLPGNCFGGRANLNQITGLSSSGSPIDDSDCDNWTNAMENCVDNGVGYNLMNFSSPTPAGQFTCFYDDRPTVQGMNVREFVMCREW